MDPQSDSQAATPSSPEQNDVSQEQEAASSQASILKRTRQIDEDDEDGKSGRERRKIEIKFIPNKSRRHITFLSVKLVS